MEGNPPGTGNYSNRVNGEARYQPQDDFYITSGLKYLSRRAILELDVLATCDNTREEVNAFLMEVLYYYSERKRMDNEPDYFSEQDYNFENFPFPDSRPASPSRPPPPVPTSSSLAARLLSEESVICLHPWLRSRPATAAAPPPMEAEAAEEGNNSVTSRTYDTGEEDGMDEYEQSNDGDSSPTYELNFDESPASPAFVQLPSQRSSQVTIHTGYPNGFDEYDSTAYHEDEISESDSSNTSHPSSRADGNHSDSHSPSLLPTGTGSIDASRTASPASGMWIVDEEGTESTDQGPSPVKKARTSSAIDDIAHSSSPVTIEQRTPVEAESLATITQKAAEYAKSGSLNGNSIGPSSPSNPGYNPWSPGTGYGPSSPGGNYDPSSPGAGYGTASFGNWNGSSNSGTGYGHSYPSFGSGPSIPGGYLSSPMQGSWNGFAPAKRCAFCSSDSHPAEDCTVHATHEARSKMKKQLMLCPYCLGRHFYKDCPLPPHLQLCGHCKKHRAHKALCKILCP